MWLSQVEGGTPAEDPVACQTLSRLSCAYKKENKTKMVVCDLGNPMKGGTKVCDHLTCQAVPHRSRSSSNLIDVFWLLLPAL